MSEMNKVSLMHLKQSVLLIVRKVKTFSRLLSVLEIELPQLTKKKPKNIVVLVLNGWFSNTNSPTGRLKTDGGFPWIKVRRVCASGEKNELRSDYIIHRS